MQALVNLLELKYVAEIRRTLSQSDRIKFVISNKVSLLGVHVYKVLNIQLTFFD